MRSPKATARRAGVLYLACAITGFVNIIRIPAVFVAPGNAAETGRRIAAAEFTYRLGLLNGLAAEVFFVALAVTLYELLEDTDRSLAQLMVVLVSISAAIGVVNVIFQAGPLLVLHDAGVLSAFSPAQRDALLLGCLRLRASGIQIQSAFWGLWLLPFGRLVMVSPRFPTTLGVVLMAAGVAYLAAMGAAVAGSTMLDAINRIAVPIEGIGEVSAIAWLLVKGVRTVESPAVIS